MNGTGRKATSWANSPEKQPHGHVEKATSWDSDKTTSNTIPVSLLGVVSEDELRSRLLRKKQDEWDSSKRISGLLLMIDFLVRKGKDTAFSSEMARDYVSYFARPKSQNTIRQPLALLVNIGILEIARPAVITPHRKTSARYRIHRSLGKPRTIQAMLSTQQRDKRGKWNSRRETGYNRKHRTRKQLLMDLSKVNLSAKGKSLALSMVSDPNKIQSINTMMVYIEGRKAPKVDIDPNGTIHTFARLVLRELKPHLTIGGEPVAICDIESAHLCALSAVVQERITFMEGLRKPTVDLEHERSGFITLLGTADIYDHLSDGGDRSSFKKSLLKSLNLATKIAVHIDAYQKFRRCFPLTAAIIEDIKKSSHKALSGLLQGIMGQIIEAALHQVQTMGIPCLPDTDALIVPVIHRKEVMRIINSNLAAITGIHR